MGTKLNTGVLGSISKKEPNTNVIDTQYLVDDKKGIEPNSKVLTWGPTTPSSKYSGSSLKELGEHSFNLYLNRMQDGRVTEHTRNDLISYSHKQAVDLYDYDGDPQEWHDEWVFPSKKRFDNVSDTFKVLDSLQPNSGHYAEWLKEHQETDEEGNSTFREWTSNFLDSGDPRSPSFRGPSRLNDTEAKQKEAYAHFNNLITSAVNYEGGEDDKKRMLPFASVDTDSGPRVISSGTTRLMKNWDSLESAIKNGLESGAISKADVPQLYGSLKFLKGTQNTFTDASQHVARNIELATAYANITQHVSDAQEDVIQQQREMGVKVTSPELLGADDLPEELQPLNKSLNAWVTLLTLDDQIRDKHYASIKKGGVIGPDFSGMRWFSPIIKTRYYNASTLRANWDYGLKDILSMTPFGSGEETALGGLPFSPRRYTAEKLVSRLSSEDAEFIGDPEAIADGLRSVKGFENASTHEILDTLAGFVGAALNSQKGLTHYTDDDKRHLNIRQFSEHVIVATPQLMDNPKHFESALNKRNDLTKQQKNFLRANRQKYAKNTARARLNTLRLPTVTASPLMPSSWLGANGGMLAKWEKHVEENRKKSTPINNLSDLLDDFVSDDETFNKAQDLWGTAGYSLVQASGNLVAGLGSAGWGKMSDITGWEWANSLSKDFYEVNKQIEDYSNEQRNIAELFGERTDVRALLGLSGPVATDIGLTMILGGTTAPIAGGKLLNQLSTKGFTVSKSGMDKGLRSALVYQSPKSSKLKLADDLLEAKAVIPSKHLTAHTVWAQAHRNKNIQKFLADELDLISKSSRAKWTKRGLQAFSVGTPAAMRSGTMTYYNLMETMPDTMTFEEKRSIATAGAAWAGLFTGAITSSFSFWGYGGTEAAAGRMARNFSELGRRHTLEAWGKIGKIATGGFLSRQTAEVAARVSDEGLRRLTISGLTNLAFDKVPKFALRYMLPEAIEEGLDEFVNSYIHSHHLPDYLTINDRIAQALFAAKLGFWMGGGAPATMSAGRWVKRKLGKSQDEEAYLTEQAYGEAKETVMDEARMLNAAKQQALIKGAPLTAEQLAQDERELMAGYAKNRVAPAREYTMSTTEDVDLSKKEEDEVVRVSSDDITGVHEVFDAKGNKIYAVEYLPEDSSGETLKAFTNDPHVLQVGVRVQKASSLNEDILQSVDIEPLLKDVSDEAELLASQEGVSLAVDSFQNSNKVSLNANGVTVLTDPSEEELNGLGLPENLYGRSRESEVTAEMTQGGEVVLIVNSSLVSEITGSMPKKRRSDYVKRLLVEGMISSFDLASVRDKWNNTDEKTRGDLADFVLANKLAIWEEMPQNERDRAAASLLGVEYKEGLSDEVADKAALVSIHISSLTQFEIFGETTETQRAAWEGKGKGGALSRAVQEKLFDILDYLRRAVRVATDAFRPLIREQINAIRDRVTQFTYDQIASASPAEMDAAVAEVLAEEATQGIEGEAGEIGPAGVVSSVLNETNVVPIVAGKSVNNISAALKKAYKNPEVLESPVEGTNDFFFSENKIFIGRKGNVLFYRSATLRNRIHAVEIVNLKGDATSLKMTYTISNMNPDLVSTQGTTVALVEGDTSDVSSNSNVVIVSNVNPTIVDLYEGATDSDLNFLKRALHQNPLFALGVVESNIETGDNVSFVVKEGKIYAVPTKAKVDSEFTPEEYESIRSAKPEGIEISKLSPALQKRIGEVLGVPIEESVETEETTEETQAVDNLDIQKSSVNTTEEVTEPANPTKSDPEEGDDAPADKSRNPRTRKQKRIANAIIKSLKRKFRREGTRVYEDNSNETPSAAWWNRRALAIGWNRKKIEALVAQYHPANAKAIVYLIIEEELAHQYSWEMVTQRHKDLAIDHLTTKGGKGTTPLITMAIEYGDNIAGATSAEHAISLLRIGMPAHNNFPEGAKDTPANRIRKKTVEDFLFEELVRKFSTLKTRGASTEIEYEWLKDPNNQGALKVYRRYLGNYLFRMNKAKRELARNSKMGPYFRMAVAEVAKEAKAAREGFRRKPNPFLIDDPDTDLGFYFKQTSLIGSRIPTTSEAEEREEWLSEIDPAEIKSNVVAGRTVGTRSPTAKGMKGQGVNPDNQVSLDMLRSKPEAYKKNSLIVLDFPIVSREFEGDPLLDRVRKAKAPVVKAEAKVESIKEAISLDKKILKQQTESFKLKERADELKPERKAKAKEARETLSAMEKRVASAEKGLKKTETAAKRVAVSVKETIKKENKKIDAKIKAASAKGNTKLVEDLKEQKKGVAELVSSDSKSGVLLKEYNDKLNAGKEVVKEFKTEATTARKSFTAAVKEADNPTVRKSDVKLSSTKMYSILDELEQAVEEGTPVRVGGKALIAKHKALTKKESSLAKAQEALTNKNKVYGDTLKKLSKSEKTFPLETADRVYGALVDATRENLNLLINMFPQDLRSFASLWYDGANTIANTFAKTYNITVEQAAGVLGVNSPQKDWYMNVALAERIMHIWTARQGSRFDGSMAANFMSRAGEPELKFRKDGEPYWEGGAIPTLDEDGNHVTDENGVLEFDNWGSDSVKKKIAIAKIILNKGLRGKRLKDIQGLEFELDGKKYTFSKEGMQARFVRMFSEAAADENLRDVKTFNVIRPDGAILQRSSLSQKGKPRSIAWGSYVTIEKSINILNASGGTMMDTISDQLGLMHKVRSFFNNIVDPSNRDGHTTMDTHAVAALLWKALSGNSTEVTQNFGGKGTASDSELGIKGLYPAFAEAYKTLDVVNEDTGESYIPREIQSITWESIRQFFPSTWKGNPDNVEALINVWRRYGNREISFREAQEEVVLYVQKSQRKDVPEEELLDIDGMVASANSVRGVGVGRPDWGQAAPVTEPPSEVTMQGSSISWKIIDAKYNELAENPEGNEEALYNLVKEASRKAEKSIPRITGDERTEIGKEAEGTDYVEIIKNPTLREIESFPKVKEGIRGERGYGMIVTPANKYLFPRTHTSHHSVSWDLGLREYIGVFIYKDSKTGEKVVYVSDSTTAPFRNSALSAAALREHFGEDIKIEYWNDMSETAPLPKKNMVGEGYPEPFIWEEVNPSTSPVTYSQDGSETVLPLSSRFKLGQAPTWRQGSKIDAEVTEKEEAGWQKVVRDSKDMPSITREELSNRGLTGEEAGDTQRGITLGTYEKIFKGLIQNKINDSEKADTNILDWGSGLGHGTKLIKEQVDKSLRFWEGGEKTPTVRVNSVEPYYTKGEMEPTIKKEEDIKGESQDFIISNVVLNVVPEETRVALLNSMYAALKEGGSAIVTARSEYDVFGKTKDYEVVGPAEIVTQIGTFQKGFTQATLKELAENTLPEAVVAGKPSGLELSPVTVVITKPVPSGIEIEADTTPSRPVKVEDVIDNVKYQPSVITPKLGFETEFMELASDPEENEDQLNFMVDTAAANAGFPTVDLFHATTHEFSIFDKSRGNLEGDWGLGYYLTSSESDAKRNYLSEGPDLTSRIEQEAEAYEQNILEEFTRVDLNIAGMEALEDHAKEKLSPSEVQKIFKVPEDFSEVEGGLDRWERKRPYEVAYAIAKKKIQGPVQRVIKAYVKLDNPAVIGVPPHEVQKEWPQPPQEQRLDPVPFYDEEAIADELNSLRQQLADQKGIKPDDVDQVELREFAEQWADNNEFYNEETPSIISALETVGPEFGVSAETLADVKDIIFDGPTLAELEDVLRKAFIHAETEEGALAAGEAVRRVFEEMGYDGIIDHRVDQKFGTQTKRGKPMAGISPDTFHVIAFNNKTIKSSEPITRNDITGEIIPIEERFDGSSNIIQRSKIDVQVDSKMLAGKPTKSALYVSIESIENGSSILSKKGTDNQTAARQKQMRQFEAAKERLALHLEEEKEETEANQRPHKEFGYDFVAIEKNQVRFLAMTNLTKPHPHVYESKRVPHDPSKPVTDGRIGEQIYHRVDSILGQRHHLYDYHKAITNMEEALGVLSFEDQGQPWPSGSRPAWKQQIITKLGSNGWTTLKKEQKAIEEKFFPPYQPSVIGSEPELNEKIYEFIDETETWESLADALLADIPIVGTEDETAFIKWIQRLVYARGREVVHPKWKQANWPMRAFLGIQERNVREYVNKSQFFKKALYTQVQAYQSTTTELIDEYYVKKGKPIPYKTIVDATGAVNTKMSPETFDQLEEEWAAETLDIVDDTTLDKEQKEEEFREAWVRHRDRRSKANSQARAEAKKRRQTALNELRKDAPELHRHALDLRSLADRVSITIKDLLGSTNPDIALKFDRNLELYLTQQYRIFQDPDWTESFLNDEKHVENKKIALEYFGQLHIDNRKKHYVETGMSPAEAEQTARSEIEDQPELREDALRVFLESYDKDFGVDSLRQKGNLPEGMRKALGEVEEDANFDIMYNTLYNLTNIAATAAMKDHVVRIGMKAGWLITKDQLAAAKAEHRAKPEEERGEFMYEGWKVVREGPSSVEETTEDKTKPTEEEKAAAELAGEADAALVEEEDVVGPDEITFKADGTPVMPKEKPKPSRDPFVDYREKTEDGVITSRGPLIAHPDVAEALAPALYPPKKAELTPLQKIFYNIDRVLGKATGLAMVNKTVGSVSYFEREAAGNAIFLALNGIPIGGLVPNILGELKRTLFPAGRKKGAGVWENVKRVKTVRSANREDQGHYAYLRSLGVLDEGISYAMMSELLSGRVTTEELQRSAMNLKEDPDKLRLEPDAIPKGHIKSYDAMVAKAAELYKKVHDSKAGTVLSGTAGTLSFAMAKAKAINLAMDNATKYIAFEYEKAYILDARENSIQVGRDDEYSRLTDEEVDTYVAKIILKTLQSRSQSAPLVQTFASAPGLRVIKASFAMFMGEAMRVPQGSIRQALREKNSSNPIIRKRGRERHQGWIKANLIGYMLLPQLAQHLWAGVDAEEDRERRLSAPHWSRRQNYLLVPDGDGGTMQMSLSYIHPLSPVLDTMLRSFQAVITGNPGEATAELMLGYFYNSFLQDQIAFGAVSDALNNEDRNTGKEIVNDLATVPEHVVGRLNYVLQKAFAPPALQSAWRAVKAGGGNYERGGQQIFGQDFYSPTGEILRHVTPLKFYPFNPEQAARSRFREIMGKLEQSLDDKYSILQKKSYNDSDIRRIVRGEMEEMLRGVEELHGAYNIAMRNLDESQLQDIMTNVRIPNVWKDMVIYGEFDTVAMKEGSFQKVIDRLYEKGTPESESKAEKADQIYDEEAEDLTNGEGTIYLD